MILPPIEQPSSKTLAFTAAAGFRPIMRARASKALMAVWENALDSYIKSSYEFLMSDISEGSAIWEAGLPTTACRAFFAMTGRAEAAFFFLFDIFCSL